MRLRYSAAAIFSILAINCYFSARSAEQQQFSTYDKKISQVLYRVKREKKGTLGFWFDSIEIL